MTTLLLVKLELENFLSHEDTKLYFDRGINVIVGPNGSGKTSVFEGIRFAMFGRSGSRRSNPVRHGAMKCRVLLEFKIDEDAYEIERTYGSRQRDQEASLRKNQVEIASSQKGVTSQVEKIVGMQQEIFERSVFVGQGEIDDLVNEQPKRRKEFFAQVIGIEKLGMAAAFMGEVSRKAEELIQSFQTDTARLGFLRERVEQINSHLLELEKQRSELSETSERKTKELKEASSALDVYREEFESLRSKISSISTLNKERDRLRNDIESIGSKLKSNEDYTEKTAEIERNPLYSQIADLRHASASITLLNGLGERKEEIQKNLSQLELIESKIRTLKEKHDLYEKDSKLQDKYSSQMRDLQNQQDRWIALSTRIKEVDRTIHSCRDTISGYADLLLRLFGEKDPTSEAIRTSITLDDSKASAVRERLSALKADLGAANQKIRELRENKEKLEGQSICPLCGTELTPEHLIQLSTSFKEDMDKCAVNTQNIAKKISEEQESLKLLEKRLEEMRSPSVREFENSADRLSEGIKELDLLRKEETEARIAHESYEKARKGFDELGKEKSLLQEDEKEYSRLVGSSQNYDRIELEASAASIKRQISDIEEKLSSLSSKIMRDVTPSVISEAEELAKKRDELAKMAAEYNTERRIFEEKKTDLARITGSIEKLTAEVSERESIEKRFRDAEIARDTVRDEITRIIADVDSIEKNVHSDRDEISTHGREIARLEEFEKKVGSLRKSSDLITRLRLAFGVDGIQKFLRKRASEYITNGTRQILSSFSLDFDDVEVGEDLDVSIERGGKIEIDALSGGERIALSIALRISISRFLDEQQKLNCFMMDEPTTYLDEERRANLRNILHYSIVQENIIPQLLLITHHSELVSAGDVVFEVSKEQGVSRVTD